VRINCDAHQGTSRVPWREPFGCQIRPAVRYGTRHAHRLPARAVAALVADTVRSASAQNPHRRERTRSQHRVIWHHKAQTTTLWEATQRGAFWSLRKVPPAHAAAKGRLRACAIRYAPDVARGGADSVDHARDAACGSTATPIKAHLASRGGSHLGAKSGRPYATARGMRTVCPRARWQHS
jgi:hypothetical protein